MACGGGTAFIWLLVLIGSLAGVEINFEDPKDGYFLKPLYQRYQPAERNVERETFILTHPAELYKLRASLGPFDVYQSVPSDFVEGSIISGSASLESYLGHTPRPMHRQIIYNMDVSAHLVTEKVFLKQPLLQVLIHAQLMLGRKSQDLIYNYYGYSQQWCGQLFVQHGTEQLSSVCVLGKEHDACVAGISLPESWWHQNSSQVSVYYDISRVEQNQECASASNTIVPVGSLANTSNHQRKFIATIPLVEEEMVFQEEKDQDLIFRIPVGGYHPGTRFEVPVLLEKNSGLQVFVIRVKVRNGLRVIGAVPGEDSAWNIYFENNSKQRSASVTAYVKESFKYTRSIRIEEIMRWQFEVEVDADEAMTGRIVWTVDYEKNGLSRNAYFPPQDSRISAKISILGDHPERIVTVFKETELLNTAALTGKREDYPLHVFAVSNENKLRDVSPYSDCFSTDTDVLRVSKDCRSVFLDGNETRGSENVTVVVHTGGHTTYVYLRVWMPESQLEMEISDTKLSRIHGWNILGSEHRKKREANQLSAPIKHSKSTEGQSRNAGCEVRMQQALIDVYARFIIDNGGRKYFQSKKVYLRVTDLVQKFLRTLDPQIATVNGRVVQGHSAGKTDVQILSPAGHVISSRKIQVGRGRVKLERILVRVVSGLTLQIAKDRHLLGALTATAVLEDKLVARQQDAVLDITLQYTDGSRMPLEYVDPSHFDLKVQSLNIHVVDVPTNNKASYQPGIRPIGSGRGKLIKVILRQPASICQYKRRPLASSHVNIHVDFSKDSNAVGRVQSDAFYDHNRASDRREDHTSEDKDTKPGHISPDYDFDTHAVDKQKYFTHQHGKFPELSVAAPSNPKVIPVEIAFNGMKESGSSPQQEALEQAIDTSRSNSKPFLIPLYVLVSVFFVVAVSCVLFTMRYYRRKRMPKDSSSSHGSVSNAKDWVWIGRATLERNGNHYTRCQHALMPEEDFNGNQMLSRPPSSSNGKAASTSASNPSSAPNSNRNSTVSTYEGSECSIRITSNPLRDSIDGGFNEAEWDYEKLGLTYEQLMDYFANLKESTA
ncbi:transmembrane protein 132C-like [Pomacea canaliculata]|uniref:transmembrane protein 132C-like n=1 Tax=Pomacea canaliculata TaxID=400727 RepID=UPI000D72B9DE|nr:transmembrane protein 132C-like [Pomacea canaliculata]